MQRKEIDASNLMAALAVGSIALLVLGLQPILLGELLNARRVSLEGVGLVAMAEIVAVGLGVLAGDLAQPLSRLRSVAVLAALASGALDVCTLRIEGDVEFALIRAAAGLAEGLLVWVATAVIVRCAKPDRVAGIFFVVQTAAQALLGLLLARLVIPAFGWSGAFMVLAGLMAPVVVIALFLPGQLAALVPPALSGFVWSARTALPLLAVFLQLATLGSLWAYVEPLGKDAGLPAQAVETLIAICLGVQVLGGSCGSALVRKLRTPTTLLLGSGVLGVVALSVAGTAAGHTMEFAVLCGVFSFTWLFITPFQMRLAFDADGSGRIASLVPAAQVFGIAFGPLAASFVVEGEQARSVPLVSAAFAAGAMATLALGMAWHRRGHPQVDA